MCVCVWCVCVCVCNSSSTSLRVSPRAWPHEWRSLSHSVCVLCVRVCTCVARIRSRWRRKLRLCLFAVVRDALYYLPFSVSTPGFFTAQFYPLCLFHLHTHTRYLSHTPVLGTWMVCVSVYVCMCVCNVMCISTVSSINTFHGRVFVIIVTDCSVPFHVGCIMTHMLYVHEAKLLRRRMYLNQS